MEDRSSKSSIGILILLLIIAGIWIWNDHSTITNLREQNNALNSTIDDYKSALQDANDNIDTANSNIEDAQSSAWGTYDEMGNALDGLETVDNIDDPQ